MSGTNPVAPYGKTDFTSQTGTAYKTQIDANSVAALRFADNFAPRAQTSPNMTVHIDAGHLYKTGTLTEVAAQDSGSITVPSGSNKRIDRAVIDNITGAMTIVTGTPTTGTPAAPAIPAGTSPIMQIGTVASPIVNGTTSLTNSMITDERDLSNLGDGWSIVDGVNTASYTFLTTDKTRTKVRSNGGSAMTDTLPQAGTTFPLGWEVMVINNDVSAPLTITPTTSTIDGQTSIVILAGRSAVIHSDGTNYYSERGSGGALGPVTSIASATTTNLGGAKSNFLNVTGTTTITSFGSTATVAFPFYILKFAAAVLLTNGANLNIIGGANYTTAAGDYAMATVTASGTWDVTIWPKSGRGIVSSPPVFSAIAGCLPSGMTGNSTTAAISVSAGQASDSTNATYISSTGYSWAVSNGNAINGYSGGTTLPNNSTIHMFICTGATGTGTFASTSLTPTLPSGYDVYYRRIFSFRTNGSGAPIPYVANEIEGGGIWAYLATQTLDANDPALGTSRSLYVMNVPTGIKVEHLGTAFVAIASTNTAIFTSPDETDVVPASYGATPSAPLWTMQNGSFLYTIPTSILTNTSGQIGARSTAAGTQFSMVTRGFKDFRR